MNLRSLESFCTVTDCEGSDKYHFWDQQVYPDVNFYLVSDTCLKISALLMKHAIDLGNWTDKTVTLKSKITQQLTIFVHIVYYVKVWDL